MPWELPWLVLVGVANSRSPRNVTVKDSEPHCESVFPFANLFQSLPRFGAGVSLTLSVPYFVIWREQVSYLDPPIENSA